MRVSAQAACLLLSAAALSGCSDTSSLNPVNWWHRAQGGKIAEERPAPPGADQPYPDLNTVPSRPTPPDQEALRKLTSALVADRTNAQHEAQATPLPDPSSPSASPALFGVGTAPPPGAAPPPPPKGGTAPQPPAEPPVASASMPAVTAPPPPPAPAPRKTVQSAPLEPAQPAPIQQTPVQQTQAPPQAAPPPQQSESLLPPSLRPAPEAPPAAATPAPAAETAPPPLPVAPPPRAAAAGAPPPPVVTPVPMPEPKGRQAASIVFPEGSTVLSAPATEEVKAFAGKRGNGVIVVTGYGEAAAADPASQSAAIATGLARAQTIVEALKAAGVPGNAIRVSAEASGRGASLNLLQ